MMSQEEQHLPGEEDGEDEEGDIEARTAVEALLALTSPTDYTHHTGIPNSTLCGALSKNMGKCLV